MMKIKTDTNPTVPFRSLAGQLLIAMPGIGDLRFHKTVIYVYSHTETSGALGLIINRPAEKMSFNEILDQLHIQHPPLEKQPQILIGGPAQSSRGFILHSTDYCGQQTISIDPTVALTATQDILFDLINGKGPKQALITLGCATWISGQLEEEIMSNVWLTAHATHEILFEEPYDRRWKTALEGLGIDPYSLSGIAGKA